MNAFDSPPRQGPLPYIFGALLGVSLGLIIISGIFFFKSSKGGVGGDVSQRQDGLPVTKVAYRDNPDPLALDQSRRNAIVSATEKVAPAVVSIASKYTVQRRVFRTRPLRAPRAGDWLKEFFGYPETVEQQQSSLGSGVVISPDGYILTNEHVIRNAEDIEVTMSDGTTVGGFIIDTAPDYDLALVKVDGKDLPCATLGNSDELLVGEWAIAIGQPFGQLLYDTQPTVTVGVISALHRDVKENPKSEQFLKDMIQTDAAINPGNSGGPLVNSEGEVIGINSFIFSSGGGGSLGMGFAIPINRGKWVLEEIKNYGRVRQAWTGLHVTTITPQLAAGLNLQLKRGLLIRGIDDDSPADDAGLEPGDVIVGVRGKPVGSPREANRIIFGTPIGESIRIEVVRKGKSRNIDLKLEERPQEEI